MSKGRSRAGMLPGESKRRSLVTVERIARPGEVGEATENREMVAQDNYIVVSRRLDGSWTYSVEIRGVRTILPGRVIDTINRHRDSIIKEERSRRAKERIAVLQTNEEYIQGRVLAQAEAAAQGR